MPEIMYHVSYNLIVRPATWQFSSFDWAKCEMQPYGPNNSEHDALIEWKKKCDYVVLITSSVNCKRTIGSKTVVLFWLGRSCNVTVRPAAEQLPGMLFWLGKRWKATERSIPYQRTSSDELWNVAERYIAVTIPWLGEVRNVTVRLATQQSRCFIWGNVKKKRTGTNCSIAGKIFSLCGK